MEHLLPPRMSDSTLLKWDLVQTVFTFGLFQANVSKKTKTQLLDLYFFNKASVLILTKKYKYRKINVTEIAE